MRDLTPYDTGARAEPAVWVTPDKRRPAEDDADRYGKVDFNNDEGATEVVAWVQKNDEGGYELHAYTMSGDGLPVYLDGERLAQPGPVVVLMRDGETFEDPETVKIIDVTGVLDEHNYAYSKADALSMASELRGAGYVAAAEEIEGQWL